jgi:putative 4-mercaptohistidine N1-methyltranferase
MHYESDKLLAEYLLFHYGTEEDILPAGRSWPAGMREALDFAVRTPRHFAAGEVGRGLDLGCAVGRSTLEMAKSCRQVIGLDFSLAFIRAAERLRNSEEIPYLRLEEGHESTPCLARLPNGVVAERVSFQQGDAMNLPADWADFDRVHAANLLCRLPEPLRLLDRLPGLVRAGGELVLATPCTWLAEFTPPEHWPPGDTIGWLKERLGPDFDLLATADEPFLIRESARKFQWTLSTVTHWRRKTV